MMVLWLVLSAYNSDAMAAHCNDCWNLVKSYMCLFVFLLSVCGDGSGCKGTQRAHA